MAAGLTVLSRDTVPKGGLVSSWVSLPPTVLFAQEVRVLGMEGWVVMFTTWSEEARKRKVFPQRTSVETWRGRCQGGRCPGPPTILLWIREQALCPQGGCGADSHHQSPQGFSRGSDRKLQGPLLPSSWSGRLGLRLCLHLCVCLGVMVRGVEVEQLWPGEKGQQMADEASSTPRQETGARRGGRGRQVSLIAPRVTICAWLAWPTWLRHNLRVAEGHGC